MERSAGRLAVLKKHLGTSARVRLQPNEASHTRGISADQNSLRKQLHQMGIHDVEVEAPPAGCEQYYSTIMTPPAVAFIAEMHREFDGQICRILQQRIKKKLDLDMKNSLPDFLSETKGIRQADWKVSPLPRRLLCRHLDLGDVSPAKTEHFVAALKSSAQGVQTDFDDGHCPNWRNQLLGLYNVYQAVHGRFKDVPPIDKSPILMLRPRAWNMTEHNMMVGGKEVAGPLFDFSLLMFHNARVLAETGSGPFFYLSKLEGYIEARLWNQMFVWAQHKLGIPVGTIRACVLIENILASYEMDEILYELKDHSAGLNCGIWDYAASFCNKFGQRREFVLPDRSKYVNMERHFLQSYMDLVVQTCHRRGALATGGMAAQVLPPGRTLAQHQPIIDMVCRAKLKEIKSGVDGFMVYDIGLLSTTQELFKQYAPSDNQITTKLRPEVNVTSKDLLQIPSGGVTFGGLKHNIGVGILFIYNWLCGRGHYIWKGSVEDSATAEISRSQVWQWLRHGSTLEDRKNTLITRKMIQELIKDFLEECMSGSGTQFATDPERCRLSQSAAIFEEVVTKRNFPEFITTYLSQEHTFLTTC